MSLRKSPQPTPQLLDAARSNAQHSTGPRTEAGKQNSKMNAVRHGERSDPQNHFWVMLALGEDPQEFEDLKKELMLSYGPGEPLWRRQIDDLARLYWRRDRLQRAQEGLMRRARLGVEERQHRRRQELAEATFDAAQAPEMETSEPADPGVRLRWRLSWLKVIREQVQRGVFEPWHVSRIESLGQEGKGWRQARLVRLLRLASESAQQGAPGQEREESLSQQSEARQNPDEAPYQELLRRLEEEIAWVQEESEYAEKVNEEKVSIERDACLAPEGDQWQMMLRREAALDRSIDRKVRILLHMRKEYQAYRDTPAPSGGDLDDDVAEMLGLDFPSEEEVMAEVAAEEAASSTAAAAAGQGTVCQRTDPATGGSGLPHPAPRKQKMNERSGNVVENKSIGRAAQAAIAGLGHRRGERLSRRGGNPAV